MSNYYGYFSIITLGCKANQFDSNQIVQKLIDEGMKYVENPEEAEIVIINTCTVTAKSDYKCRQTARKWKKSDPKKKIILTGCYAERSSALLSSMEETDLIINRAERRNFADKIIDIINNEKKSIIIDERKTEKQSFQQMTRALFKIQDGCDQRCSYCIVPFVRGASKSVPAEEIIKGISDLEETGFKEVILTGIHIGKWGYDLGNKYNLLFLLRKLIENTNIKIRLSSLEPNEVSPEIIEFVRNNPTVRPHFHIPLQSGSDIVLKDMNRHYHISEYEELILNISRNFKYPGIGTDIIAGFPTETEKDFQITCDLIERLPFSYLHIFPYSKRPGTSAANLKESLGGNIKTERARHLRNIGAIKKQRFIESQIGTIREVLILEKLISRNRTRAVSDNYIQMEIPGADMPNQIVNAKILLYKNRIAEAETI